MLPADEPHAPERVRQPRKAIVGLVVSMIGLIVPLLGLVGLVLSVLGYRRAKQQGSSRVLSVIGIVVGSLASALGILMVLGMILLAWLFTIPDYERDYEGTFVWKGARDQAATLVVRVSDAGDYTASFTFENVRAAPESLQIRGGYYQAPMDEETYDDGVFFSSEDDKWMLSIWYPESGGQLLVELDCRDDNDPDTWIDVLDGSFSPAGEGQ